jgi:NADH-quinone oxidoreductase subunit E
MNASDWESALEGIPCENPNIITILQAVQKSCGYLRSDALSGISDRFNIPLSKIYGVATFYAQFRFDPPGEHNIRVCHGTACHINGAVAITESLEEKLGIKTGGTTKDGQFSLENVACLGCCSLSPVIMIGEKVYGKLDRNSTARTINEIKKSPPATGKSPDRPK